MDSGPLFSYSLPWLTPLSSGYHLDIIVWFQVHRKCRGHAMSVPDVLDAAIGLELTDEFCGHPRPPRVLSVLLHPSPSSGVRPR